MNVRDHYEAVNALWPTEIPPLTREEARRANRKLQRKFLKRRSVWLRQCWVSSEKTKHRIDRGWHRLVHDVSHRAYSVLYPINKNHHSSTHAELEADMIKHVLASGWLGGKLRPKLAAKPTPTSSDKIARLQKRIARWQSKRKRAETALRKLARTLRYYERKATS